MQKYADVVLDRKGNVVSGASVLVKTSAGANAQLYSDNGITPRANPVTTDSLGRFAFYAENGRYNLQVYIGSVLFSVSNDILLEDPLDETPEVIDGGTIKNAALENVTIDGAPAVNKTVTDALEDQIDELLGSGGRWCGASATAPTTRLDGSPLQEGDEYQDTDDHLRYNWTGSAWVALNSSATGLETRMADSSDPAKGAGMEGYSRATAYDGDTTGKALNIIKGKTVIIGEPGYKPVGSNIDAAVLAAINAGAKCIEFPDDRFEFTNLWRKPIGVSLRGRGGRFAKLVPKSGGDFAANGGRLIIGNGKTTPSVDNATWQTSFPNMMSGEITNLQFVNEDSIANLNGLLLFGSYICDELWFDNFRQSIARPSGLYVDSFELHRVFVQKALENDSYQVAVLGLGDGFVMRGCHFPYDTANVRSTKAAQLRGIHGGVVDACIGGDYLVELCGNLNIVGGHFERAQHIYDSSSITIDSQFLPDTRIPIITRGTFASASNESRFTVKLQNTKFRNIEGLMQWSGFHVQAAPSVTLDVENATQEWTAQGDFQRAQQAGIRICQEDGASAVTSFNNNSWLTSKRSIVEIPGAVNLNHGARMADSAFSGIASSRVEAVGTRDGGVNQWLIAAGTYYYNVQVLYDTVRAIGRNPVNTEVSLAATLATMNVLNIGFGTAPRNAIIRLYRGTSPGVYSDFVDIHSLGTTWLHDNGLRCNGIAWQSRTPAAMNTINSMGSYIKFEGTLVELTAAALPNSAGSFTQGDRVKRTDGTIDAKSMLLIGNHRLTTGSGGVVGTDWANMRVSHVTPVVP